MSKIENTGTRHDSRKVKDVGIGAVKVQWTSQGKQKDGNQGTPNFMTADVINSSKMFFFFIGVGVGFASALAWVVMFAHS